MSISYEDNEAQAFATNFATFSHTKIFDTCNMVLSVKPQHDTFILIIRSKIILKSTNNPSMLCGFRIGSDGR